MSESEQPTVAVPRTKFFLALKKASFVCTSSSVNPLFSRVRLRLHGGILETVSTNGEQTLLSRVRVGSELAFDILVSCQELLSVLQVAPDEDLLLSLNDSTLTVKSTDSPWVVPLVEDYQAGVLDMFDSRLNTLELRSASVESLLKGVEFVWAAVPKDGMRVAMFQVDVKQGCFVACDGLRLHRAVETGFPVDLSIPASVVPTLLKLLRPSSNSPLYVGVKDNKAYLVIGSDVLSFSQAVVAFPSSVEHSYVTPCVGHSVKLSLSVEHSLSAIKQVQVLANDETKEMSIDFSSKAVEFSSTSGRGSAAVHQMKDVEWKGARHSVLVNVEFFLHAFLSFARYGYEECILSVEPHTKKELVMLQTPDKNCTVVVSQLNPIKLGRK